MKLKIPPPIVALICALIMWAIADYAGAASLAGPTSRLLRIIAPILVGLGVAIDLIAISDFSRVKTTITPLNPEKASNLVVKGPYRFTRNPMYLGMVLILCGVALWLGSPINILVLVGFIAYITAFQIKPEERALEAKFGDEFRAYKERVRRWL